MGDAEFAGGGSVDWQVTNSDGESGGGNKKQCKGKDKDPKGEDGSFAVIVNGSLNPGARELLAQVRAGSSSLNVATGKPFMKPSYTPAFRKQASGT